MLSCTPLDSSGPLWTPLPTPLSPFFPPDYATMSTTIEGCLFAHNTVLQDGGAIATASLFSLLSSPMLPCSHATVPPPHCVPSPPDYATMSTSIEDSLFARNTVLQDGGAIATAGLMPTVVHDLSFIITHLPCTPPLFPAQPTSLHPPL
ncbi:unnamed protein product [Closterium sp. NIES-54]